MSKSPHRLRSFPKFPQEVSQTHINALSKTNEKTRLIKIMTEDSKCDANRKKKKTEENAGGGWKKFASWYYFFGTLVRLSICVPCTSRRWFTMLSFLVNPFFPFLSQPGCGQSKAFAAGALVVAEAEVLECKIKGACW